MVESVGDAPEDCAPTNKTGNNGVAEFELGGKPLCVYAISNNCLLYTSWQYGAMNACFTRVGDTWYWAKTYGGGGIFRVKDSDINGTTVPAKIIFPNAFVKSFVVDTENRMLYAIIREKGFYAVPLDDIEAVSYPHLFW